VELAHYEHRAGFKTGLNTEPIFDRYSDLFTREAVEELKRALDATPEHLETERAGLHKLYSAACVGHLEMRAKELTDERALCESSVRVEWDGESLSLYAIPKALAHESSHERRRELSARWAEALDSCRDLRGARFESFHDSARTLGFDSYRALYSHATGTDYLRLSAEAEKFLERTEAAYTSALASAAARDLPGVTFGELEHADYPFFQRLPRLDAVFPARELMRTYVAAMGGLGIRAGSQKNIHIDDEPRPMKNPRAACFRVRPPDDVRLLIAPVGGAYDYIALFHEAGHAQHFGWCSRELFERHPEFIYAPDNATTEGYAFLLNHLLMDAAWLEEHRGGGPADFGAGSIVRDVALLTAYQVRRLSAKLKYEIALHDSADVRSEHLANTYSELQRSATGFRRGPAFNLADVDDGFYSAAYLRAYTFEVGLREHLRTRYGRRWWASKRAGDELIDLWNTASRYTVEELARLVGFGGLSFDLLADTLVAAMNEG
jgi:hypothetical protein